MSPDLLKEHMVWIRWLYGECQLEPGQVADLLGLKLDDVAAFIEWRPRKGAPRVRPQGPPRRGKPSNPQAVKVTSVNGKRVRKLRSWGYQPTQIGVFLALHVDDVRDFLRRAEPVRGRALKRPRTRMEHIALRPALPPFRPPPREPIPLDWNWRCSRDDAPAELAAAAPIADQAADQAEADQTAGPHAPAAPAPSSNTWNGPESFNGSTRGNPKLSQADREEIRRLRAEGWSTGRLSKRFGVTRSTVCNTLSGLTFNGE